ncbi:MAG: insulinase family protein, partial [Pseudolabrys sp.]|nr:insulinase family protein [Pseudolabrys sp.]
MEAYTVPAKAIVSFTAIVAVAAALSAPVTASGIKVADFTLANGLELVVIPDRRAPVVTHMIWYKVGAADETPGKSGLAHFLEHLMFKGTAKNPANKFSQAVARIGGQENAFTSNDYTGYFQRVPREQLKTVMEFEADRMTGLVLTDKVVLPERDVILEEQNQRVANNPRARLSEQIDAALYLNHPYGKPVIGWRHEMEQLSRDDAIGFYRRFYGPNGAVVVIAGDVEPEQVRKLAEETYGKLKRNNAIVTRKRPQEPAPVAGRSLTLADPRVEQPMLQRSYLVPSFANAKPGQSEALEV